MLIKEIENKDQWENFILSQKEPPFLQSWNWGEFHKSLGDKIFRLGIFENEEIVGAALVIRVLARRGHFLFLPYGPIMKKSKIKNQNDKLKFKNIQNEKCENLKIDVLKTLTDYLKKIAKEEKCVFVRISPLLSVCNDLVIDNVSEPARNASQASACSRSDAGGENVKFLRI